MTSLTLIVQLFIISTTWYVTKVANSKSVSYKDKATVCLGGFSALLVADIAIIIWAVVSIGSNNYLLILAIYAMAALISAWILKFYYMRKI